MKHLEAQKEEIIKDYEKGLSLRKLAKYYHCSVNTMRKHLVEFIKERNAENGGVKK